MANIELDYQTRLNVADAFVEVANRGAFPPEMTDEIIPRLVPENYPDIQDWYSRGMSEVEAKVCGDLIDSLGMTDRISGDLAAKTRSWLGIVSTAA